MSPLRSLLVLAAFLLAQPVASTAGLAADPQFPPGARIGAIAPGAMAPSQRFIGFEDARRAAAITFVELPSEAFADMAKGMTNESLASQGFMVKSREEVTVGTRKGVLLSGDQEASGIAFRKWLMFVEDPALTAFVVAQARREDEVYSEAAMRNALLSLAIRAPLSLDEQLAALSFRVGDLAGFRVLRAGGTSTVLLTDGPKDAAEDFEQPSVLVVRAYAPLPPAEQRDALARQAVGAQNNLQDVIFERSQSFRQKGADWHEIVARANDARSGQALVVTQTIRFTSDGFLRMLAIAREDQRDKVLSRLRGLFDSIEPK